MNTSFDTIADDMPTQFLGLEYRKKIVHSVGAVGLAKWTVVPNTLNYTGIFASGCENVIVRFSSAFRPGTDNTTTQPNLAPAVGLKFLIDGYPSVNIFGLGSLSGQTSYNFFLHDISNHLPDIPNDAPFSAKVVRDKFSEASDYPMMLGLSKLAMTDASGYKVTSPKFPFRIIYHPTTALHNSYPDTYPGVPYYDQLSTTIQPGVVYEIYAIPDPQDDSNLPAAVQIATVSFTTAPTTSYFGDLHLFLEHGRFDDDLKIVPSWVAPTKALIAKQQGMSTQYFYPDLPFN